MSSIRLVVLLLLTLSIAACGPSYIRTDSGYEDVRGFRIDPEAEIPDVEENREIVDLLLRYREAVINKDVGDLKRMIADDYYENAGTTVTTGDDYGISELERVFEMVSKHADSIRYDVVVKDLKIDREKARIDYEYSYSYRYDIADQATWDAGNELNRLEFEDRDGEWKIVSGL